MFDAWAPFVLAAGYWVVSAPLILLQIKLFLIDSACIKASERVVLYKELSCKRENQRIVGKYIPKLNVQSYYDIVVLGIQTHTSSRSDHG